MNTSEALPLVCICYVLALPIFWILSEREINRRMRQEEELLFAQIFDMPEDECEKPKPYYELGDDGELIPVYRSEIGE